MVRAVSGTTSYFLGSGGVNPSSAGTEFPSSRRAIYIADCQYARVLYAAGGLGDCAIGVNWTADGGSTWQELLPYGPTISLAGAVNQTQWLDISQYAPQGELVVAAFARGTALSLGLLFQLSFIDLQVR